MTQGIVPVGSKPVVARRAIAEGRLEVSASTVDAIRKRHVPKADVEAVARTAALLAVKNTPQILPYCHPIPITAVDVRFRTSMQPAALWVRVTVDADYRTGVEMEALTGAMAALLTAWDLVKPLEKDEAGQYPGTRITGVRVVEKRKG
jgi:cyclic pyranopterin monophosphate synthase